ncbi:MAG TPA: cytochrome c maturation protein CcmE [Acidimicrobiales bacterium]|nr:cytochrome c maturation protein CcmE [Acidimicrobiales bacterium]
MTSTLSAPPSRPPVPPLSERRRRSRRRAWSLISVVVVALGFLLFKGLEGATTFFYTADQAVHMKAKLGSTRFNIEGTVVRGSVHRVGNSVDFSISNNGVTVPVSNTGYPPQLFQPGIPVVLEGAFSGSTFDSDLIMVKHSADYVAAHPQRVKSYVGKNGTSRSGTSTGGSGG